MDKHLKTLAPKHADTKFIKLDAEVGTKSMLTAISVLCVPFIVKVFQDRELVGANYLRKIAECTLLCYQTWNQDFALCRYLQVTSFPWPIYSCSHTFLVSGRHIG